MSKYLTAVKWLGGIAILLFVLAYLFINFAPQMVSEQTQNSVLFRAIPFFFAFVGVLLLYILLIVLVALRFNGKVPRRTYKGIENLCVAGMLFGTVCMFNPWSFIPYHYGFPLILAALLTFILWSHVTAPRADADFAPLTRTQHIVGIAAGLLVLILLVSSSVATNAPQAPYGLRERVWNSYTPERQAEVAAEASQTFYNVELPFLIIFYAFPATLVYLIVRELAGAFGQRKHEPQETVTVARAGAD